MIVRKQVRILNPSKTILLLYDRKIDTSTSVHLLSEDEIKFLRSQGFIVAYDKPSVKRTMTVVIE